ncbi:MAG: hypothetical protein AAFU79_25375 [Myxococcota bacterium]
MESADDTTELVESLALDDPAEEELLELDGPGPDPTVRRPATSLPSPQPLPDSAFIDSPESSTRDLLMDALDTTELELLGDDLDPLADRSRDRRQGQKTYSFLPESQGSERRGAARFPLALETEVVDGSKRHAAFATSGSVDAFFIRAKAPIEQDQKLMTELRMLGSYYLRIPAVVVRLTEHGFVIQLDPNPKTLAFRSSFLELARQPSMQAPRLRLEVVPTEARANSDTSEESSRDEIVEAWSAVLSDPEDEETNQEFIHTCMRAQNLEYAVDRYREQQAAGSSHAEKYLDQIGTILGFYNMPQNDIPLSADGFVTGRTKGWVALILALIVAVGAAQFLLSSEDPKEPAPATGQKRGAGLIHVDWEFGD